MKNIRGFLSENFQFLGVKFSIYLNRHVFIMYTVCSGLSVQILTVVSTSDDSERLFFAW